MPPLTYPEVRSNNIDVDAQRSMMRTSKIPLQEPETRRMRDEVFAGRLLGIYAEDQQKPAKFAIPWVKGWWNLIPKGEDAVVVLDPNGGAPLIAFRRTIRNQPARIDAALKKAFRTYELWQADQLGPCVTSNVSAQRVPNIVPSGYCYRTMPVRDEICCCGGMPDGISLMLVWVNGFIPSNHANAAVLVGPNGRTAIPDGPPGRFILTDNRSFDSGLTPGLSRFHTALTIDVASSAAVQGVRRFDAETVVNSAGSPIAGNCRPTPSRIANWSNFAFSNNGGLRVFTSDLTVNVPSACTTSPFTTTVTATLRITFSGNPPRAAKIELAGTARAFAIEAYAAANLCDPIAVVQSVLNAPASFPGVTTRAFSGEVNLLCRCSDQFAA